MSVSAQRIYPFTAQDASGSSLRFYVVGESPAGATLAAQVAWTSTGDIDSVVLEANMGLGWDPVVTWGPTPSATVHASGAIATVPVITGVHYRLTLDVDAATDVLVDAVVSVSAVAALHTLSNE